MLHFIFTLDYELYANGSGALRDLVYEPTARLASIFKEHHTTFVVFAEVAELQKIEEYGSDESIGTVTRQLRRLYEQGFEIGLHIHPWWCNAQREKGTWRLDWSERNLCSLPKRRVKAIVAEATRYLRTTLAEPCFVPLCYRAGTWIMQPTAIVAQVLSQAGVQIDSSVFKGGRVRDLNIDYRTSKKNGHWWRFTGDVNLREEEGILLELPIFTQMRPFWSMLSRKRLVVQTRNLTASDNQSAASRLLDLVRFYYPRKLDFCRMDFQEIRNVVDLLIREDQLSPDLYKPIVAIGHSKDLVDFATVDACLEYLRWRGVKVVDFQTALAQICCCENKKISK
jgi:hypothetical protein